MTADAEDRELRVDGEPVDADDLFWYEATKRPVTVEATPMPAPFEVETLEGTMQGDAEDVLIRGVEGELYPCDLEVFAQTYDVDDLEDEQQVDEDRCGCVWVLLGVVLAWKLGRHAVDLLLDVVGVGR